MFNRWVAIIKRNGGKVSEDIVEKDGKFFCTICITYGIATVTRSMVSTNINHLVVTKDIIMGDLLREINIVPITATL